MEASFSIETAARDARERLATLAPQAARDQQAAARLASAAIFQEALLGALRARVAELKTVAR